MRTRWRVLFSNGSWYVQSRHDWDSDWLTHCACRTAEEAMRTLADNYGDFALEVVDP